MLGRGLVPVLVAAALLASGCTQQGAQGAAAPDFAVRDIPPSPSPGGAAGAGGLVPGGAGPAGGVAPGGGAGASPAAGAGGVSGPTAGLGSAIVACAAGTPWEYTSGSVASVPGYRVTYAIQGKSFFKGAEYCKVSGKVEITQSGVPVNYLPTFDYYFRTDPSGSAYADIWYVYTVAGQTQEVHVLGGAGGATVAK